MVIRSSVKFLEVAGKGAVSTEKIDKIVTFSRLPPLPSPKELLKLYKIHAQRSLSQNFLLDFRLNNKIVTKTGNVNDCYVCEIGPGPGNITRQIIKNGAKEVTVIEKDARFMPSLQLLADACHGHLKIIKGDIMDFNLENIFPKQLARDWTVEPPPFYIIGNLPFNISTPLIIKLLRHCSNHTGPFIYGRTKLSLTFQKEVADRMVADARSDVRCRLSVMCQHLCRVENLFTIPGKAFFPKPEVDVSVVKFTPLIQPLIKQPFDLVEKVMNVIFHHRQKYCRYCISLLFPDDRSELAEEVFRYTGIKPERRPYQLEMEELSSLCDIYNLLCKENKGLFEYNYRAKRKIS